MRYKSTDRMEQIKQFVEAYYEEHRSSPSMQMIADRIGSSKSTAYRYITDMAARGYILYDGETISTAKTIKQKGEQSFAGILGSIQCGTPIEEEENIEEYVPLPRALFGKGQFFILRAKGYSMINAGIEPGDLVVIRKQETANPGDIVVALVNNTETTLKRWQYNGERFVLHPENDEMEDIVADGISIQGIAIYVMKKLAAIQS